MTDNDIIKALECCKIKTPPYKCEECPLLRGVSNSCIYECKELAYDLINRQKAEIERLTAENEEQAQAIINALHRMKVVRAEAIREFAEKIKKHFFNIELVGYIDSLVEEMMEGEDDKTE